MRYNYIALLMAVSVTLPAFADDPLRVEFLPVIETQLTTIAGLTGTIEPVDSIAMGFPAGGRVIEVLVEAGDRVAVGDPLARTDPLQQDQALREAQAALASAEAARDQAAQAEERAQAMLDRGVGTRAATDQARQGLSQAAGAVQRSETGVDQARRALEDTILRAPEDAIVTQRSVEPGQIVGPAQVVLTLAALSGLEAVFQVSDSPQLDEILGVEVALRPLDVSVPAMKGHVTEVSPLVDPRTGAVAVRVRVDGVPSEAGLLGTAVRGTINYIDGQGIELPWTALTSTGDQAAVWVVGDDDTVTVQPIEIARFVDGHFIVRSGLAPGQVVIGAGSQMLYPGRNVVNSGEVE